MTDPMELVERLDQRAIAARSENTATALGDAIHFEQAAACIRELVEWRPIETAPKDGTEVLVQMAPKVIRLGWYFKPSSRTEGWCDENGKRIIPTHWLPLPPPPADRGGV